MPLSDPTLRALADAYGISTEFWDWKGRHTEIDDVTVIGILAGMGVPAGDEEAAAAALRQHGLRHWRRALPPCTVLQQGQTREVAAHVPAGAAAAVSVRLEDGGEIALHQVDNLVPDAEVDGQMMGEAT
ncbi:MAG: 4-alpha-glucanotransferase, partial [Propioniciclava sp.]